LHHLAEHVEPWTYVKFPYLRNVGWKGFVDGEDSGILSVTPLARLNVANKMSTPQAQEAYEEMFTALGGKPVHHTLANHWARVVEMIYAAERLRELANDPEILDSNIRKIPTELPKAGIGVVEAPRGTLIHHYETDQRGVIGRANLIVATQNNSARMALSVDKAARNYIKNGRVDDGMLNMVEMAFRTYDPCHACATHSLPGSMPLMAYVYSSNGELVQTVSRNLPKAGDQ
jgi:F420-non-reducing hydrogenase large subunit